MNWARKRQLMYLGGLVAFIILFVLLPLYFFTRKAPTCFDGEKNGDETGVDCGGSCELVCAFDAEDPVVHWDESFKVRENLWSAAAYVENPNNAYALNIPYVFKLLDSEGVLVTEKEGIAYIPPQQNFVIIEPSIEVGNRLPSQEFFEFNTEAISWIKPEGENPDLSLGETVLSERSGMTRLSAFIFNPGTISVSDVVVSGVLYDINGNALAVSETFIEEIPPNSSREAIFTWPRETAEAVTKKEVLYVILP